MSTRKRAAAVPSYLKHNPGNHRKNAQARVIINGRVHYLGRYGSEMSYRRYDQLIAEWLASSRSVAFGQPAEELQMVDLMLAYLHFADAYYGTGDTSEAKRIRFALKPLERLYAELHVVEYGPMQFKATREHLIGLGWARSNINDSMKRIVQMVKWAAGEGMVPPAIHETLRLIAPLKQGRTTAKEAAPVKPVCGKRVSVTLGHCSPVVADMVRVQLLTGCRPGEVVKLTPGMIDRSKEVWVATLE
jgi:integrase